MKIRRGFVSNSSSSSFVVAAKNDDCEIKINIQVTVGNFARETASTQEELDEYILDEYGWNSDTIEEILEKDPWVEKVYKKALKAIKKGYTVYFCVASNDDGNAISTAIYDGESFTVEDGIVLDNF